jgi:hypothetical protein
MAAAIIGLLGVVITAIVGLVAAWLGYLFNELRHRREMGVKMIEIALGILAGKPDENKPLRDWAVDVLEHYSKEAEVPLGKQAKDALRDKALPVIFDAATGRSYMRGAGAIGEAGDLSGTPLPLRESARERQP